MVLAPAFAASAASFHGLSLTSPRHTLLPFRQAARPAAPALTCMTAQQPLSRRSFIVAGAAAAAALSVANAPAFAFGGRSTMSGDYKADAAQVLTDMRTACDLGRGAPGMAETVGKTRKEMNDFVALYRRNDKVSGSTSFSTLYTAINTLSGHYASYGSAYPVPEKRKKRLTQQFSEIDRALNRGR